MGTDYGKRLLALSVNIRAHPWFNDILNDAKRLADGPRSKGETIVRRKLASLWRYRPRVLTVVVLLFAGSIIAFANLSFDTGDFAESVTPGVGGFGYKSYGWPIAWHRYVVYRGLVNATVSWHYSPARLAADLAIWLGMLAAAAAACRWLQRRYPPRLRFSLRVMLAAVAIIAAFCAWYVGARNRADEQEPLIAEITAGAGRVMLERWGPKWLDLFGVDPLRRRIIGLEFTPTFGSLSEGEYATERIGRLLDLQYLFVRRYHASPSLAAALGKQQRLRVLSLDASDDSGREKRSLDACLSAISRMPELEHLYLANASIDGEHLAALKELTQLKWLSLESCHAPPYDPVPLDRLPAFPQLETLDLFCSHVSNRDLARLAALPRLKSLNLQAMSVTDAGLAELGSLDSLEELAIDTTQATARGLESLLAIKKLRQLHIKQGFFPEQRANLPLDGGVEVLVSKLELDGCLRALKRLRREKPGIVIDRDPDALYSFFSMLKLWRAHDTTLGRRAAWLPESDYPWTGPWGRPAATPSANRAEWETVAGKFKIPTSF